MFNFFRRNKPVRFVNDVDIVLDFGENEITAIGQRRYLKLGQTIEVGGKQFTILEIEYYADPRDMFRALLEKLS